MLISTQALTLALELRGVAVPPTLASAHTVNEVLALYQALIEAEHLPHLHHLISCHHAQNRAALEQALFYQGVLPSKIKLLAMLGNHIVGLQAASAHGWLRQARAAGVSDGELADLGFVCLLTAGIPAWFECCELLNTAL